LAKYDADGTVLWIQQFGTAGGDEAVGIAVSGDDIYVTGVTEGAFTGIPSKGGRDMFVARYSSDGDPLWVRVLGTPNADYGHGVAIDDDDNIYVSGGTYGALDGLTSAGGRDALLSKWQADGTLEWVKQFGTSEDDDAGAVALQGSVIFVAGYTGGALDDEESAGAKDAFLSVFSPDGDREWSRLIGTSADELFYTALSIDESGDAILAGCTKGSFENFQHAGGDYDGFLARVTEAGSVANIVQFGTSGTEMARGLALGQDGTVYVTGDTTGAFGETPNGGMTDIYVLGMKFSR